MEDELPAFEAQSRHLDLHGGHGADALLPGKAQTSVPGKIHRAHRHALRHGVPPGQGLQFALRSGFLDFLGRAPEAVFVDEPDKFQLLEELIQGRFIVGPDDGIPGGKVDGRLRADGGKVIGQVGVLPVRLQLFPELRADGWVIQVGIDPIQAAKLVQQVLGGLGAHPGNARDVVRGVSHEGLQVNKLFGLEAVLLPEHLPGVQGGRGLAGLGDHQLHMDVLVDELQRIPVAGDNDALPVVLRADPAHGADDIVGLPALALVDGDVHGPEDVLHNGHLLAQLLGHGMAGGLIARVFQVAEGGGVEVKSHAHRLGLLLLLHPFQNVQKAVDGMGAQPLPGGQGLYAEKGTIDDAVAV